MTFRPKLALARVLSSRPVGLAVGAAVGHRVRNRGLLFDTLGWDPRVEAMLAFRVYESAEIRFIRSFLRGTHRAIELGGSLGVAGSHLLHVMAVSGSLTSVEANPYLIAHLERTLNAHAANRSVVVVHAAVTGDATAFLALEDNTLWSRLAPEGIPIPARTLSAIASAAGYDDYALLSDIEGAEASFIFGHGALDGCTRMVIELHDTTRHGRPVSTDEMVAELRRGGFKLLDRRGNVCALAR